MTVVSIDAMKSEGRGVDCIAVVEEFSVSIDSMQVLVTESLHMSVEGMITCSCKRKIEAGKSRRTRPLD